MALYALADLHLSISTGKTMGVFSGWADYENRIRSNWQRLVTDSDTVILPGDISWCMDMEKGLADFEFLNSLPGRKIILKGNHDYWWATVKKCNDFFMKHGFENMFVLFNNAYECGNVAVCGTRGWFFDAESDADKKIVLRECGRLRASIAAAKNTGKEPVVFLHYPPVSIEKKCSEIYDVLLSEGIKRCYYGHLHSYAHCTAFIGKDENGIDFNLVSADYLGFCPKFIPE
ncbi:MAG: metallophosphoesterase [Clostridiales bacterium]|nr:metallophosphoesterase [Clostridiales bacterium]